MYPFMEKVCSMITKPWSNDKTGPNMVDPGLTYGDMMMRLYIVTNQVRVE